MTTLEERAAAPDMTALDPGGHFERFGGSLRKLSTDAEQEGARIRERSVKSSAHDRNARLEQAGAARAAALVTTAEATAKAYETALRKAESDTPTAAPVVLDDLRAAPVWREPSPANGFEGRYERATLDTLGASDLAAQVDGWRRWIEQHADDTESLERLKSVISQGDAVAAYALESVVPPVRDLALGSMLRPAEIEGADGMLVHLREQCRRARDPEGVARVQGLRLLGDVLEGQVRAAALAIRKHLVLPLDVPAQIIPILSRLSPKSGARPLL